MAGRPPSEKTFANMLRVAIKEAHEDGKDKLRAVADALVAKAMTGDVSAIREIGDRLDGKPMQAIEGDFTHDVADPLAALLQTIASGGKRLTSDSNDQP